MGIITRGYANLITATGPNAIADGTIVNADINASAGIDASKLTGLSSDYVLLATSTASTSASVSFDGYFSSTYKNYVFMYSGVRGDADSYLRIRYRKSNADVTASNYNYINASSRYVDSAGADSNIN